MKVSGTAYDVGIVGAGPVGCVTALAFARRGARVLLLEANPGAADRLAGEWLHPPAVEVLQRLGVSLQPRCPYPSGKGFVVWPDDGSPPIVLPYAFGSFGHACEHGRLVAALREQVEAEAAIEYRSHARVRGVREEEIDFEPRVGGPASVRVGLVVGAGGRSSVVHETLGARRAVLTYSRMAGVLLQDVELPFEGYGHVIPGGPGPILAYRIDARRVRMCLDVPFSLPIRGTAEGTLWDAFAAVLPPNLRKSFRRALSLGSVKWAINRMSPRRHFGADGIALVGDAVGHYHPLTGIGMTLGFKDGETLAGVPSTAAYRRRRSRENRVAEMLAVVLYEVFASSAPQDLAIRRAMYQLWRRHPAERQRTMGYLSGHSTHGVRFSHSFVKTVASALRQAVRDAILRRESAGLGDLLRLLSMRVSWVIGASSGFKPIEPSAAFLCAVRGDAARNASPRGPGGARQGVQRAGVLSARDALERGIRGLQQLQARDGSWEGEVVWCPMLAAQYVFTCHITGTPISPERRRRLLRHFEDTRLSAGTWGMHELAEPQLFMTTLVYVASRILRIEPEHPLLSRAREFIRTEGGAIKLPSWGKFWLALLNLYSWEGVHPILPELWRLPLWFPLHPSRYYCHTRHIYLGMAILYGERFRHPATPLTEGLRSELYTVSYDAVDFKAARDQYRLKDLYAPPGRGLRWLLGVLRVWEQGCDAERRRRLLAELREHVRFELRATVYTNLSPVSGLLNILALWAADPRDPDALAAIKGIEGWIWEDEHRGARVAGARSATWDTAFAVQALAEAQAHSDAARALERADGFLHSQQIRSASGREAAFFRADPRGGYCFAGVWHGWPVSDCTAEAMLARLKMPRVRASCAEMEASVRFILQSQNRDGGFGSYEARRVDLPMEWLNPAEMFGGSMTEKSYVECTASCIQALAAFHHWQPYVSSHAISCAIRRAAKRLRLQQRPDGSWPGTWGVHFIYGTLFGVRGLLASGAPPQDPSIRHACAWLRSHQRPDGGWGEDWHSVRLGTYVDHKEGQVVQTAWALMTLLEAQDSDWTCIERGVDFLCTHHPQTGGWPRQDPAGIFFYTALLDYTLYRCYFPIWALALYESRRAQRLTVPVAQRRDDGSELHDPGTQVEASSVWSQ